MFVTWKPQQLTLVSNVTNTSMFYVELRVRRGCYVRIARDSNRVRHRSGAMDSQLKQANTMVVRSKKELGTPTIGQTVAVPIPTFDRGKGDSRNLLGRIIEVFNLTIFL
jgi:hypothetical protein